VTLAIRPERISLSEAPPPEADHAFQGIIQEAAYGGAETQFTVEIGSAPVKVRALNTKPPKERWCAGTRVYASFPAGAVLKLRS
jgi:hypothetical protein